MGSGADAVMSEAPEVEALTTRSLVGTAIKVRSPIGVLCRRAPTPKRRCTSRPLRRHRRPAANACILVARAAALVPSLPRRMARSSLVARGTWSATYFASPSLATFFFFQAEDGIRDIGVTGVQTCALPISVVADSPAFSEAELLAQPHDRLADIVVDEYRDHRTAWHRAIWRHADLLRSRFIFGEIGRASCRKDCRVRLIEERLTKTCTYTVG